MVWTFGQLQTGNEPVVSSFADIPGFVKWHAMPMGTWIASNLGPTIQNSEFSNVEILILDDWRSSLPWFVDAAFSYKDAKKYIQGIAVHWYDDNMFSPKLLDVTHDKYPDKFILNTEACTTKQKSGIHHGSWRFAESYARDILQDLNHWCTGWIDWNIALNMEGGPTYIHNEVNTPLFIDEFFLTNVSYFSKEGLEYNLVRVPIGSTDFSLSNYTYDDGKEDPELAHFALVKEDLEYKIPLLQLAKDYSNNTLQLLASAWMAPDWMQPHNRQGYIKESMYQIWANYHLEFLKAYKEHGLDFWAITSGNEPITYANFPLVPFVKWRPKRKCEWIASNLGPTLENSEFSNIKILTMDDWRSTLLWSLDQVLSCKNAKKYVQGIALHWYVDKLFPPQLLDITHDKYPDKFILYTEACVKKTWSGMQYGSWKFAESYAIDILQNLNHWNTGWVDWNIALNMEGGPTYMHNEVNSPIFVDASKDEFYKQPMYYILGHFSKFIPQGSVRIEHKCSNKSVSVVAMKRPDGGIVIVILNKSKKKVPVTINVEKGKYMNLNIIAKSIITVIYW